LSISARPTFSRRLVELTPLFPFCSDMFFDLDSRRPLNRSGAHRSISLQFSSDGDEYSADGG
jgi:hypothetical protein